MQVLYWNSWASRVVKPVKRLYAEQEHDGAVEDEDEHDSAGHAHERDGSEVALAVPYRSKHCLLIPAHRYPCKGLNLSKWGDTELKIETMP